MNTLLLVGNISLNISFFLYLILYIPQIIHNRHTEHLLNLSLSMHFLLYTAYLSDLFYGYSSHLPWQYKTVSMVGLSLLIIQHLQLTNHFMKNQKQTKVIFNFLFFIFTLATCYYFFIIQHTELTASTTLIIGSISRAFYLLYCLPQIIKNKILKSANAMSIQFLYLNLSLSILDMISAWCLNWGWPNKISAPVMSLASILMLLQVKKYRFQIAINRFNYENL
ncbi:MAG: PQ-loop repeat-containing protein [Gammaproteobacteria bacterium]|nr:PQ-loop repeat-containing protein [Gammaproteobacteria bacterium]